jgi:serine/threonine protein kinase
MGNRSTGLRPDNTLVLSSEELLSVIEELASPGGKLVVNGAAEQGGLALGQYMLEQKIGAGAFGNVYRGFHRMLRTPVAVKVLQSHLTDSSSLARFRREMRAQARLKHPGFARALDAFIEHDTHCLVMEFVDGYDVHAIAAERGRLCVEHAVEIIRQAAEAMAFAHAAGMIHRDLKPGNLMIDRDGVVRVMDLGLAKCDDGEGSGLMLTREGIPMGTVDFLAPEQAGDAGNVTGSADIYALGCTLYYLLCGHAPFSRGSLVERLIAHQNDQPQSVDHINREVPAPLARLVDRMLAKRPEDRPASMQDLLPRLLSWTSPNPADGKTLLRQLVDEHARGIGVSMPHRSTCDAGRPYDDTHCPSDAGASKRQTAPATVEMSPVTIITCEAPWRTRLRRRQTRRGLRQIFRQLIRLRTPRTPHVH